MARFLQGAPATLTYTWLVDGAKTDPSGNATTVDVVTAAGTVLRTGAAATRAGTGVYTLTLTAIETALLDRLTVTWTSSLGTVRTVEEIVGGFHVTVPQLRALAPLGDGATYPTADLAAARDVAETLIEKETGRSFVPRYWYGTVSRLGRWPVEDVRALRSVVGALGGAALSPADFPSVIGYGATWRPRGPWVVGLEYGMDYVPADVSRATALLARSVLIGAANIGTGTLDDRATSVTYADAGLSYSLTTAGVRDAATSIPEVNSVIIRYGPGAVVA